MTEHRFEVGDLVTRDGSDVHRVTEADDGCGCFTVICVKAPTTGWTQVGVEERNLSRRYDFAGDVVDAKAVRIAGALAPPK